MPASIDPLYLGAHGGENNKCTPHEDKNSLVASAMNAEPLAVFLTTGANWECSARSPRPTSRSRATRAIDTCWPGRAAPGGSASGALPAGCVCVKLAVAIQSVDSGSV